MNRNLRFDRFTKDVITQTPLLKLILLLVVLWLIFSAGLYFAERGIKGAAIASYGDALYWGIAAFSTAGIADAPLSGISKTIGGIWIILGSMLFFGTIVATVTAYFMRPLQRPARQIVETIEYNLERLEDLSIDELDILKDTIDTLIVHMETLKKSAGGTRGNSLIFRSAFSHSGSSDDTRLIAVNACSWMYSGLRSVSDSIRFASARARGFLDGSPVPLRQLAAESSWLREVQTRPRLAGPTGDRLTSGEYPIANLTTPTATADPPAV